MMAEKQGWGNNTSNNNNSNYPIWLLLVDGGKW